MAEAAIGRAALILGLDASGLKSGLAAVRPFITRTAGDLQSALYTAGAAGAKGLTLGVAGLAGAGAAGLAGFAAATEVARERLGELAAVVKAGDAFGLSGSQSTGLFGLMASAGSDARDASEGLVTLGQRVTEALSGKGEVAADLFKGLNVGAERFQGLNPADQFYLLVDSLGKVPEPAKRVQLLLQAVGEDTGKNLMPLLGKTGEQARALAAGFALSAGELSKVAGATNAMSRAESVLGRVKDKLAVAASPFIEAVAGSFDGLDPDKAGQKFEKVYGLATDVFTRVREYAGDQFSKLSADLDGFLSKTVAPAVKPGADAQGNPAVSQFAKAVAEFGKHVGGMAGGAVDTASGIWNRYSSGFDNALGSAQEWIGKQVGSATAVEAGRKLQMNGAAANAQAEKDLALPSAGKWEEVGQRLGLQAGNAIARTVDNALAPKSKALDTAIDLSMSAVEAATASLNKASDAVAVTGKPGENTAYLAGTAEELSYRLRMMTPTGDVAKQQLAEAKKQSGIAAETRDAIKAWAAAGSVTYPVADF